jgi:hypothetical protein
MGLHESPFVLSQCVGAPRQLSNEEMEPKRGASVKRKSY